MQDNLADFGSFLSLDIRVGTILSADDFPEARNPSYILKIDFGNRGVLKSSAQITKLYKKDDLPGRQVVAVVNFPEKQIGPIRSQCLVLGSVDEENHVTLLRPERKVENGLKIS